MTFPLSDVLGKVALHRVNLEQFSIRPVQAVIPLTYKSFYYEMTKAADRRDWSFPEWQERLRVLAEKDAGLVRVYDLLPLP